MKLSADVELLSAEVSQNTAALKDRKKEIDGISVDVQSQQKQLANDQTSIKKAQTETADLKKTVANQ